MRFTLKHLQYFVAASDTGSIKLASERINISQPSISTAITHLERELKVQLFVRHHAQGLSLTLAGKTMLREAKLLLRQAQGLYAVADELNNEVGGPLSVGCLVTLAPMIVPELGHTFTAQHPAVRLAITEGDHKKLLDALRQVEIDVAVSYDLQVPDDILFEPLASLPPHVLLAKGHRLAGRSSLDLGELADEPMILLDLPYSREYFLGMFQSAAVTPVIHARSASQEVIRTLVANGYGFTIVNVRPKNLTALDGRELVSVKLEGTHKAMTIGIATLRQHHKPRLFAVFEQHCREMISDRSIPGMTPA